MKPADDGKRTYTCPFLYTRFTHHSECELKMYFHELNAHLVLRHETKELLAWMVAATWEDVCSSMEARCE